MVPWLFVIDDFLRNVDSVRAEALTLNYQVLGKYPGRNSVEKINIEGLEQAVSNIVRLPLHAPWRPDFSHRNCRLSLASDNDKPARIHVDISQWTGVLCLSRDEDCVGGTEFYRHKRTGLDRVPMDPEGLKAAGFASYEEVQKEILDTDALDRSKWELSLSVPFRYNRLVLIQPHYWHTAGPGFGDSVENGRLVYVMFFNVASGQA